MTPDAMKCHYHRTNMDTKIFELNAGVHATSLYILICSRLDEGQRPTLNGILPTWSGSADELVLAVKELSELKVLQPMETLDYEKELLVNTRERWSWCKWRGWR